MSNTGGRRKKTDVRAAIAMVITVCCLVGGKATLFPEHPDSWYRIHDAQDMPLAEVRSILSQSGAKLVSTRPNGEELWRLQHTFGSWTVDITPGYHDRLSNAHVRYDSTVFPSMVRMRNYPR